MITSFPAMRWTLQIPSFAFVPLLFFPRSNPFLKLFFNSPHPTNTTAITNRMSFSMRQPCPTLPPVNPKSRAAGLWMRGGDYYLRCFFWLSICSDAAIKIATTISTPSSGFSSPKVPVKTPCRMKDTDPMRTTHIPMFSTLFTTTCFMRPPYHLPCPRKPELPPK